MSLLKHSLLVAALSSLLTWLVCRWWYGRKFRPPQDQAPAEPVPAVHVEQTVPPPPLSEADPISELRLASVAGAPVQPFLDTSPMTHVPSKKIDVLGEEPDKGLPGSDKLMD